jgi:hypothetical protein
MGHQAFVREIRERLIALGRSDLSNSNFRQ